MDGWDGMGWRDDMNTQATKRQQLCMLFFSSSADDVDKGRAGVSIVRYQYSEQASK